MARPGQARRTVARSRGRPSVDEAAQIDREILDAARELFLNNGYERTSMAQIVDAARVSKTTLYARYATKAALFEATVMLTIEHIANATLSPGEKRSFDLQEGLVVFGCDALGISFSQVWSSYERLVVAEGPRFPELTKAVAVRVDLGIERITRFIEECAGRDGIPCRDAKAIAAVYVMALRGFYMTAVSRLSTPGPEASRRFVESLVASLVASREDW